MYCVIQIHLIIEQSTVKLYTVEILHILYIHKINNGNRSIVN